MKHLIRKNNEQIRHAQAVFAAMAFQICEEVQQTFDRQNRVERSEIEEAGELDICLDYDIFEGRA